MRRGAAALIAAALAAGGALAVLGDSADAPEPAPARPAASSPAPDGAAPAEGRPAPPASAAPSERPAALAGAVTAVVDGDTVKVQVRGFETVVRLVGIDTPETRHPRRPVQCFGPEASARAALLMPIGARVRLESDPTQDRRDRFGRLLAYVYRDADMGPRASVNHALVASGHARVLIHGGVPFRHAAAFLASERTARREGRGLWGPACRGGGARAPVPPAASPACDPNYSPCLPRYPPDLDCAQIEGPVRVLRDDPHALDRDGDGRACER